MHTILVPVDGSGHSMKALHIACDLAQKYGGRIELLHVIARDRPAKKLLGLSIAKNFGPKLKSMLRTQASEAPGKASADALRAVGKKILEQAAGKIRHRSLEFNIMPMETGNPVEIILIALMQTGASTIVMGSRGASDEAGASSFGSVSHAIFAKAKCTCISVK